MSDVGKRERATQNRIIELFRDNLGYNNLGNREKRAGNSNIEREILCDWLRQKRYDQAIINRAVSKLEQVSTDQSKNLYNRNHDVYDLLRYGVKIKPDIGENFQTVWLIDWENPENNHFAIAEEVTVESANAKASTKRPDLVLYVNGIALGVIELKRSTVSVEEGIRQNLDNQKKEFIQPFFSTVQILMAGNDAQGIRYGVIETPQKYYLTWKEDSSIENLLDRHITQLCSKSRFLELIHNFVVFDSGTKKLSRHNQYFGVKAAQDFIERREGGIIWHTQGSGKSLTMVWLTKWIRENVHDARVLLVTDRTELDEQIEKVFKGVNEDVYRTKSGADLIDKLNATTPWLICSLIHKFGGKKDSSSDMSGFISELQKALPSDFAPKGNFFVFVDECHRTQSGELHKAMKDILPDALFIGFTGTPLLKADKQKSIEVFGRYIHTYKFNEAVADGVVLDLRYEARDIDQIITSPQKIDQWFDLKTKGLNSVAKAQLKSRWGTLQKVLSSQSRLEQIVEDILLDMETRPRLVDGRGNAMLVSSSIYQACKFYELFSTTSLAGKCAIVTSYKPSPSDIKGEETGEGYTERLRQYEIYRKMLADWFEEPPESAVNKADRFEIEVKKQFIEQPGQMRLLIVVDKLLTGFDAPSATYLYIDKQMRDHGLFQAICRVNRLDGDDKEYGYIVDYKDLFQSLQGAVQDYTSGALDGYDKGDVAGLLEDRIEKAKERLEDIREKLAALCEPVAEPKNEADYFHYFCGDDSGNIKQLKENEPKRLQLYKLVASLIRAFANIANDLSDAGYSSNAIAKLKAEVSHYTSIRDAIKLNSGDYIDLKVYEPDMRYLIDRYIRAEETEKVSSFDDSSLVQLIVDRGVSAIDQLPDSIRKNKDAVAETIENNVRRIIVDEQPINPKYYEKMSELLDALIKQRREKAIEYQEYLAQIAELAKQVASPSGNTTYPPALDTQAKQSLYDNLDQNESLALAIDKAIWDNLQDGWRNNSIKTKMIKRAIKALLTDSDDSFIDHIMEIVREQNDY
jgi:type I restriction enzyme R subunit